MTREQWIKPCPSCWYAFGCKIIEETPNGVRRCECSQCGRFADIAPPSWSASASEFKTAPAPALHENDKIGYLGGRDPREGGRRTDCQTCGNEIEATMAAAGWDRCSKCN